MINKIIQLWASRKVEDICTLCQSIRLAVATLCGSGSAASFGGLPTSIGVGFLLAGFLSWNYRAQVMVYVTKARIWFAQRRAEDGEGGL